MKLQTSILSLAVVEVRNVSREAKTMNLQAHQGACRIGAETRQECQKLCDITSYCDAWSFKESIKARNWNNISHYYFVK